MIVERALAENSNDFERTITGLECHQLERHILEMEEKWDKVIEYHSFKCLDSDSGFESKHEIITADNVVDVRE